MTKTVSALYDTYDAAHSAVSALEAYGVPNSDISLVANNVDNWHRESNAAEGAGTGAGVGAAIGGVGGLLTGLGIMAIPGVGPVVAAGWLVATAVGAVVGGAAGAATGGIIGSLTEAGVPETENLAKSVSQGSISARSLRPCQYLPSRSRSIFTNSIPVGARGAPSSAAQYAENSANSRRARANTPSLPSRVVNRG